MKQRFKLKNIPQLSLFLLSLIFLMVSCAIESEPDTISIDKKQEQSVALETFTDVETGVQYSVNPNWKKITETINNRGNSFQGELTDWSGNLEVGIWAAYNDAYSTRPNIICEVPPDYVCIGGGAYIQQEQDAFLTEARPLHT